MRQLRLLLVALVGIALHPSASANTALFEALAKPGHFALIRHALAPGMGDPDDFELENCSTQRNLNGVGRQQAKRIGQLFKDHGIAQAEVYTSQWCRCRETATLLGLGKTSDLPSINSFFQDFSRQSPQSAELTKWLQHHSLNGPLVLVTHQVNITAFSGVYPASGEIVVMQRRPNGDFQSLGTIPTLQ